MLLHLFAALWDSSHLFPLTLLSLCEQSSWQQVDWDNILTQLLSHGFPSILPSVHQEGKQRIPALLSQEGFLVSCSCLGG